jgi:hypothetical protein
MTELIVAPMSNMPIDTPYNVTVLTISSMAILLSLYGMVFPGPEPERARVQPSTMALPSSMKNAKPKMAIAPESGSCIITPSIQAAATDAAHGNTKPGTIQSQW